MELELAFRMVVNLIGTVFVLATAFTMFAYALGSQSKNYRRRTIAGLVAVWLVVFMALAMVRS